MSTEAQAGQQQEPQVKPVVTGDDYSPFSQPVNEKPYARPNINVSHEQTINPIAEPVFSAAPLGGGDAYSEVSGSGGTGANYNGGSNGPIPKTPPPVNPSMAGASDEEKKHGSKQLAKMIMDGYEFIHEIANGALKFDERKLAKLQADGEIDLSIPIPYDYDKTVAASDFIRDHNEIMNEKLRVTPQFKKEVMPVMERVLEKHGAGLTDEQFLVYAFGKDVAVKGFQFAMVKRQMKDMIEMMKEYTLAMRASGQTAQGPQATAQQRQQTTASYEQAYTPSPVVNTQQAPAYHFQEPEETDQFQQPAGNQKKNRNRSSGKKNDPEDYFSSVGKKRGRGNKQDFKNVEDAEEVQIGTAASDQESGILD